MSNLFKAIALGVQVVAKPIHDIVEVHKEKKLVKIERERILTNLGCTIAHGLANAGLKALNSHIDNKYNGPQSQLESNNARAISHSNYYKQDTCIEAIPVVTAPINNQHKQNGLSIGSDIFKHKDDVRLCLLSNMVFNLSMPMNNEVTTVARFTKIPTEKCTGAMLDSLGLEVDFDNLDSIFRKYSERSLLYEMMCIVGTHGQLSGHHQISLLKKTRRCLDIPAQNNILMVKKIQNMIAKSKVQDSIKKVLTQNFSRLID